MRGPRCVTEPESEPESTVIKADLDQLYRPGQLRLRRRPIQGLVLGVTQRKTGDFIRLDESAAHRALASALMTDRGTVVDQGRALSSRIPGTHRIHTDLELEGGRDSIAGLKAAASRILTVRVQIDEARRDDQPRGVDRVHRLDRVLGERHDDTIPNAHGTDGVKPTFWVDDPSSDNRQVNRPLSGLRLDAGRRSAPDHQDHQDHQ